MGIRFLYVALVIGILSVPIFGSEGLKGTLTLSGAWAIYPTAVAWGQAFEKAHPGVKVDVSAGGAGKGASDAIAGLVDIGMVSREPDKAELGKGVVPIYVLKDAVFPVVSEKNPSLKALLSHGIKPSVWKNLYVLGLVKTWEGLVSGGVPKSIHLYTRSDSAGAAAAWAKFSGNKKQEDLKGVGVFGDPALLETAKRDPLGIGYNNFSFVFTPKGELVKGIALVPIDVNENGIADPSEVIHNREEAIAAIEAGTYPVARKNYFFVKGKVSGLAKAFIQFALSEQGSHIVEQVQTSLPISRKEADKELKSL